MVFARTILAALIAFSVAVLPASGQAMIMSGSASRAAMVTIHEADAPCCPCCSTHDDFKLTACALKCVGLVGVVFPATHMAPRYLVGGALLRLADDSMRGFLQPPPTHPPPA